MIGQGRKTRQIANASQQFASVLDQNNPAWQAEQKFNKLLQTVRDHSLDEQFSMRKQRAYLFDEQSDLSKCTKEVVLCKKRVAIQARLRRGKFADRPYYKTERERLEAEEKERTQVRSNVNFEEALKDHKQKYHISECETLDRTYPACKSQVKAPTQLEPFMKIAKDKIWPRLDNKPNSLNVVRNSVKTVESIHDV